MCGFAVLLGPIADSKETEISIMERLSHRGPDSQRIIQVSEELKIIFTRLAIRDIQNGDQPYLHSDGKFISCINGELYNETELRTKMNSAYPDCILPTGDMQLLGLFIARFGNDSLKAVDGMFAGFLLNLENQEVIVIRDKFGEKPAYSFQDQNNTIIMSEIPNLSLTNKCSSKSESILFGIFHEDDFPMSNFREIPKASISTFRVDGTCSKVNYWKWPQRLNRNLHIKPDKLNRKLDFELKESIRSRLISDVPISIMLSGGTDSSLLAAYIAEIHDTKVKSFTLGMNNKFYDESENAKKIADYLNMEHQVVKFSNEELAQLACELVEKMDFPIFDPACLSLYALSKVVSNEFKVSITGDGGDELFMGYKLFKYLRLLNGFLNIPNFSRMVSGIVSLSLPKADNQYFSLSTLNARFKDAIDSNPDLFVRKALSPFAGTELFPQLLVLKDIEEKYSFFSKYARSQVLESYYQNRVLPNLYLPKSDRMSMFNGLELRTPYLNSNLVEIASQYPSKFLLRNPKGPLKNLAAEKFPKELVSVSKKGFSPPFLDIKFHIKEPEWDLKIFGISREIASNIWNANNQNTAFAAWSLFVLNTFNKSRNNSNCT